MNSPANWMHKGQRSRSGLLGSTLFGGRTKDTHGVAKVPPSTISSRNALCGGNRRERLHVKLTRTVNAS